MSLTLTTNVLNKYPNNVFVETGSYLGGGIDVALESNFPNIYSIEMEADRFNHCQSRFKDNDAVSVFLGDSVEVFPEVLKMIDEPATFWLDCHWYEGKQGENRTTLYYELDALADHPIKNNIIMIDDIRLFGQDWWGKDLDIDIVIEKLLNINPEYYITYEDNMVTKNDILVASV